MKDLYLINSEGKGSLDPNSHYEHHNQHPWNGIGVGNRNTSSAPPSHSLISLNDEYCADYGTQYNTSNFRRLTEICGHSKCRRCLIMSEDGCTECSLNSARPTSTSSPGSISNDTVASGRPVQSTSAYSDSGASEPNSCLRFPVMTGGGGVVEVVNDGYAATIDLDTMAERTSPSFSGFLDFNPVDIKCFPSILDEGSDLSKGLMSLRKMSEPINNNSSSNSAGNGVPSTSAALGTNAGVANRTKELPAAASTVDTSSKLSALLTRPSNLNTASSSSPEGISKNTRAASAARAQQQAGKSGENEGKKFTGCPTASHSSGSPVTSLKNCNPSLTFSAAKESSTPSSSSLRDNRDKAGSPKPSTSTGGPTGPLRSTDGEPVKKRKSPLVIQDHITLLGGDPVMYQCNICNKKFKTTARIKYHEFCKGKDKPFKCETCGKGFTTKHHYKYHLRTHTGERPYACPECGKGFNQRGKMTRHMRSHTREKPFVCQECNRGFATAQALRTHTLIHTGDRPFACTYCDKRFTGRTNLKKHVITHTGERPFSCPHCGKSFALKWTLDLHLRTHSSERPYACDQCSRAFSNSTLLGRHLVIHSGENPFKCWICNTAFRRKDNLETHIDKTHHQSKEVAKQLANEAAEEYLRTLNNQNISNIPVSRVNSVVISNIIKNNNLMPANAPTSNRANQKVAGSSNAPGTSASSTPSKTPRKKGGKSAMSHEKEDYPTLPQDNLKRGRPSRNKQNVEEIPSTSSTGAEETFTVPTPTPQS